MTESLAEIATRYGTDKVSKHSYMDVYESLVGNRRDEEIDILEIGVNGTRNGASIRMWLDAFPMANVFGLDVQPCPAQIRTQDRYEHAQKDAYDPKFFDSIRSLRFDLIIDDGPHLFSTQVFTVREYSRLLSPRGILVVEDIDLRVHDRLHELGEIARELGPKFGHSWVDLRPVKDRYDDVMFVVHRSA